MAEGKVTQAKDKFNQSSAPKARIKKMGTEPGTRYGQHPFSKSKGK
jgi:hypothetical protein